MSSIITHSAQETIELGKRLASKLRGGEVICLYGNLGAGKTTLIKGIAQGLGVKKIVTSPTFILINVYKVKRQMSNVKCLIHIDCYRIDSARDIENIGAAEYFGNPNSVVVIEWPERIKDILPKKRMEIHIAMKGEGKREISINF
ncbi:MAG: putative ATPase or kinase [Parcubacteria group bacterium GW2011_GWA2_38_13]|nr:MAG: putative ATPase or kinase [Parcubacteria group bacterium GW2011_GWA2_38_13]